MKKPELFLNVGNILGEGICWDETKEMLFWVDILGNKIFAYDTNKNELKTIDVGQNIGCVTVREKGGLVAGLEHGIYFVDVDTGELARVADTESDKPIYRFNDGECDCMGRLWVGTMLKDYGSVKEYDNPPCSLYCLDTNLLLAKKLSGVTISNGIGFSVDNKTMYYIDTPTRKIDAFDFEKESGEIINRRTLVHIDEREGWPDGMTVDTDGNLWVGMWGGGQVNKYEPTSGEKLESIKIPTPFVTTMVFGGKDMDEMFINTAKDNTDLNKDPNAGCVFKVKMDVKGKLTYKFKG